MLPVLVIPNGSNTASANSVPPDASLYARSVSKVYVLALEDDGKYCLIISFLLVVLIR